MTRIGAEPEHTIIGARLRERTQQLAPDDPDYGYAHAHLAEALGRPLQQFQEAFDPEDADPFETLLDPSRCPVWALPWLAQLVGVTLPATFTGEQARSAITGLASHKRGTTAMLEAAAGLYLTGEKTVYFRERDASGEDPPYTLEVVTLDSETPDPERVQAALLAQKPGGIVLRYRTVTGWDYQALTATGPDPYSALPAVYPTYRDLQYNEPGGA